MRRGQIVRTGAFIRAFRPGRDTDDPPSAAAKARIQAAQCRVDPDQTLEARRSEQTISCAPDDRQHLALFAVTRADTFDRIHPNGQKMASGSTDGTARTWTFLFRRFCCTLHKITAAIQQEPPPRPRGRAASRRVARRRDSHKAEFRRDHAIELMAPGPARSSDFTRDVEALIPPVKYDRCYDARASHQNDAQRTAYLDYVRAARCRRIPRPSTCSLRAGGRAVIGRRRDHPGAERHVKVNPGSAAHPSAGLRCQRFTSRDEFYVWRALLAEDRGV